MKVLIFAPDAYSVFHPETAYIFGGIEIEAGYHARGLAQLGMEVTVAVRDQGGKAHSVNGVTLMPIPHMKGTGYWKQRTTFMGRIKHRLFGDRTAQHPLEELFRAIAPDCAYIMGMSPEALKLQRYCTANKIPFIFRVAHDSDLGNEQRDDAFMLQWARIKQEEAEEVIRGANAVIAQTPYHADVLRAIYSVEPLLIFPPLDLRVSNATPEKTHDVFWVGRTNSFKRPELLLEVARMLPEKNFCMVLNKVTEAEWQQVEAAAPANVQIIESVPPDAIEQLFASGRVFLSTSTGEGFPNTFLQAAKFSVPIVSMHSDPNGMLSVHGAGFICGEDIRATTARVQELLSDPTVYEERSRNARNYVERFNDHQQISRQYFELITQLKGAGA